MNDADVHVWSIRLDVAPEMVGVYRALLQDEERARAERFVRDGDAARYITCRGAVRAILGSYLAMRPQEIALVYSQYGKPDLGRDARWRFNVSHSADAAFCAVATRRAVGVDVERIDPALVFEPLADRFFSQRERAWLRAVREEDRRLAFYRCWTRKEAYVKATGCGLSQALDAFAVSIGRDARLLWASDRTERDRWCLAGLDAPAGCVGAVAVERSGRPAAVRQFDWSHQRAFRNAGALCELG